MSWVTLRDLRGFGAVDAAPAVLVPQAPAPRSPLEALMSARARAAELRSRLERISPSSYEDDERPRPSVPLPPLPQPAPEPRVIVVPAPTPAVRDGDLWKLVGVGVVSGLIVSMLGRR